ncbi:hypothetical protein QSJ19_24870 [Gordonia sp. ABSL11-1]|uniref:hypothetical protein n=1 Tax=Gordonia sp. ABSL11-1 TaxID=3053924 RepID=UPI0025744B3B|nr:hypothetical protein [Gordonia sp. ABSL11-1]MDL9948759.1 hypothetical protein [Gordonia sp. ABSL11-1]
MDVMQTVLLSLFLTPIIMYALVVVSLGVPLLRSSRWEVAFQRTAVAELDRRGLWLDTWAVQEFSSALSMVGPKVLDDVPDEVNLDHLAAVSALADGREVTAGELLGLRRVMLLHVLRRQRAVALRVRRLRYLPTAWSFAQFASGVEVAVRGVVWVLRTHAPVMKQLFAGLATYSVVAGVIIGAFVWLGGSATGSPVDVAAAAGTAISWMSIAGVWLLGSRMIARLGIAVWGEPRRWTGAAIASITASTLIVFATVSLYATGVFEKLTRVQQDVAQSVHLPEEVSIRIFSALLGAGMFWMAWGLCRMARFTRLRLSERISSFGVAVLIVLLGATCLNMAITSSVLPGAVLLTRVALGLAMLLFLVSALVAAGEWFSRRQRLIRAGIVVPRRGFGLGTGIVVVAVNSVTYLVVLAFDKVAWTSIRAVEIAAYGLAALMLAGIALALAWCVAGWLYVRRVDSFYEKYRATLFVAGPAGVRVL